MWSSIGNIVPANALPMLISPRVQVTRLLFFALLPAGSSGADWTRVFGSQVQAFPFAAARFAAAAAATPGQSTMSYVYRPTDVFGTGSGNGNSTRERT